MKKLKRMSGMLLLAALAVITAGCGGGDEGGDSDYDLNGAVDLPPEIPPETDIGFVVTLDDCEQVFDVATLDFDTGDVVADDFTGLYCEVNSPNHLGGWGFFPYEDGVQVRGRGVPSGGHDPQGQRHFAWGNVAESEHWFYLNGRLLEFVDDMGRRFAWDHATAAFLHHLLTGETIRLDEAPVAPWDEADNDWDDWLDVYS